MSRQTGSATAVTAGTETTVAAQTTAATAPSPTRTVRRALRVSVSAAALSIALTCALAPASATPPPNPSDTQISQAEQAKQAMADKVGNLTASVLQAQNRLAQLSALLELAEQKSALAQSQLADAKVQATAAQAAIVKAEKDVEAARGNLASFVHDSYVTPSVSSGAGNLLSASDPNALLQRGDYVHYVADRHLDAVSALDKATVVRSNAVAKSKALVLLEQKYAAAAAAAQVAATQAAQEQRAQTQALTASLASYQTQLASAQEQLATLNGQRATYNAYVKEQARLAAIKAAKEKAAREAAARLAAQIAAENAAKNSSGSGQSSSDPTPLPAAGSMGDWSAGKGQAAANRALKWLGQAYSWAAGNYNGPTYGVNSPGTDGWNDSTVYGFDCSGLSMYAWAPQGLYLAHYAATQYTQAGSYHPSAGNFMPGDLLFWSSDGSIGGIHHVAIYIGNGNVVQAPNSGDVVKITPWDQVSWGYFGATRPLT